MLAIPKSIIREFISRNSGTKLVTAGSRISIISLYRYDEIYLIIRIYRSYLIALIHSLIHYFPKGLEVAEVVVAVDVVATLVDAVPVVSVMTVFTTFTVREAVPVRPF